MAEPIKKTREQVRDELEYTFNDTCVSRLYDTHSSGVFPRRDWDIEEAPVENEHPDDYPLIYVHQPTGHRYEVEVQVWVRSLPTPEEVKRQDEVRRGQLELHVEAGTAQASG